MMTITKLIEGLKLIEELNGDPDIAHEKADNMLIDYIGNDEVTKAYQDIKKWYA